MKIDTNKKQSSILVILSTLLLSVKKTNIFKIYKGKGEKIDGRPNP